MKIYKLHQPLKRKGAQEFAYKNQYGMLMTDSATEYYLGARCCLLNNFFVGLTLAAEAVERILKAMIYFETGKKPKAIKSHNPYELKEELKNIKNYNLDHYDDLLKRLKMYFQDRYPDNPDRSIKKSTGERIEVDELWLSLVDKSPMPEEVKFRSGMFPRLFDNTSRFYNDIQILTFQNKALNSRMPEFKKRYEQVMSLLYPTENKISDETP